MALDNVVNSPRRTFSSQPSLKRQFSRAGGGGGMGSFTTLVQRHRFLLTALVLLAFLCTVYLYFAVTHQAGECSELIGVQKATCQMNLAKASSMAKGKLKFF